MSNLTIAGLDIPLVDTVRPEDSTNMPAYVKQVRQTNILPKGWKKTSNTRPLPCGIIYDENVAITMRDGAILYCDILRPDSLKEKIPALLAMSPYGKGGHGFDILGNCPFRVGIPESKTSGLEKFESVDPADWALRGYAIVNVDIRGSWESDGDLAVEGTQPGVDGYDVVEFVAALDWCNGSVGMQGNSWLATTQWATAIQQPPSLKAIAPWEGFTDMYRHMVCRGGIPNAVFFDFISNKTIRGRHKREDITRAMEMWPLMNGYWADKNLDISQIKTPMYALASYGSAIHGNGTIRAYQNAKSPEKWLRIHATQEWYDLYVEENNDELQKFFDHYLKGIDNGWEATTPVRVSVLRYNQKPIVNQPYMHYPPSNTIYKKLFMSESTLSESPVGVVSAASYVSDDTLATPLEFVHVFNKTTTLVGFSKAKLWMSCADHDDMDVYLIIRKVDKFGKVLEHVNVPFEDLPDGIESSDDVPNSNVVKFLGATGVLRVSHRAQDPKITTDIIPFHAHDREDKVPPGTIIPVEIGLWPIGVQFEKGEGLMLRIQGFLDQCQEFPQHTSKKPSNLNKGSHIIHFGGNYDSHLVVPIV